MLVDTHAFFLPLELRVFDRAVELLLHVPLVRELLLQPQLAGFQLLLQRDSLLLVEFNRFL